MDKTTGELLDVLKSKKDYSDFVTTNKDELLSSDFFNYLNQIIEKKKIKRSDIILLSNLDKNYAYQILNGTKKNPSRDKIIMLCFGMKLNEHEIRKVLKFGGFSDLYVRNKRDAAIIFSINKKMTLIETNELLMDMNLDILK